MWRVGRDEWYSCPWQQSPRSSNVSGKMNILSKKISLSAFKKFEIVESNKGKFNT